MTAVPNSARGLGRGWSFHLVLPVRDLEGAVFDFESPLALFYAMPDWEACTPDARWAKRGLPG